MSIKGQAFLIYLLMPLTLSSCIEGVGSESIAIAKIWWLLLGVSLFAFFAIVTVLLIGLYQNSTHDESLGRSITWASIVTSALLIATLVLTYDYSKPMNSKKEPDVIIQITGKMWWWEIKYFSTDGKLLFETANEFLIPIHQNILLKLRSSDVIHSFWIPSLAGKRDMIPGHENELWLEAQKLGEYRGQCAEFCGVQHAKMALLATVVSESDFQNWVNEQSKPAQMVTDSLAIKGRAAFQSYNCVKCHSVRGEFESELKAMGPDLTHMASRKSLAALAIPNNKGHLAAWLADPQGIKPGNLMPATPLSPEDLKALLHYLRGLK